MRKRNKSIYVRMTEEEYEDVIRRIGSSGQTVQSYLINAALTAEISSAEDAAVLKNNSRILEDVNSRLKEINADVYIMTLIAERRGVIPSEEELAKLYSQIREINDELLLIRYPTSREKTYKEMKSSAVYVNDGQKRSS